MKFKMKEKKMDILGNSASSSQEVQQISCNPFYPEVVASVSGNNVLVWDL